jgi:hypothetical protein
MGEDGQEVPYRRAGWAGNERLGISRHRYAEYTPGSRRNSPSAPGPAASSHHRHHHRHHHHHHRHSSSSDENRRQDGPAPKNEPVAAPVPSGKHAELTPACPLLPRCIQEYASQDLDRSDLPREEKSPGNGAGKGPSAASELAETNWEAFVESGNDGNGSVDAIEVIERGLAILNRGWKGLRGNREAQGALGRAWSRHGALSSAAIGVAESWRCEAMRLRTLLAEHGIVDAEGPGLGRDEGASHQFVSEEELEEEVVRRVKTHLDMAAQQLQDEALMERQQRRRDVDAEDFQEAGVDSRAGADRDVDDADGCGDADADADADAGRGVDDVDGGGDDSEMDGDDNDGIGAAAAKQNDQQPMLVSKVEALEEGGLGEKLGRLEAKVGAQTLNTAQISRKHGRRPIEISPRIISCPLKMSSDPLLSIDSLPLIASSNHKSQVSELEISRMQLAGELAESEQLIERWGAPDLLALIMNRIESEPIVDNLRCCSPLPRILFDFLHSRPAQTKQQVREKQARVQRACRQGWRRVRLGFRCPTRFPSVPVV